LEVSWVISHISPQDIGYKGIGEENKKRWLRTGKCSFLPEEREMLKDLTDWGLFDSYRTLFPEKDDEFSWFDYRSKGFEDNPKRGLRIDHISGDQKTKLKSSRVWYRL
jgi:Exonuclease III